MKAITGEFYLNNKKILTKEQIEFIYKFADYWLKCKKEWAKTLSKEQYDNLFEVYSEVIKDKEFYEVLERW